MDNTFPPSTEKPEAAKWMGTYKGEKEAKSAHRNSPVNIGQEKIRKKCCRLYLKTCIWGRKCNKIISHVYCSIYERTPRVGICVIHTYMRKPQYTAKFNDSIAYMMHLPFYLIHLIGADRFERAIIATIIRQKCLNTFFHERVIKSVGHKWFGCDLCNQ